MANDSNSNSNGSNPKGTNSTEPNSGRKWGQAPVVVKDWAFIQAAFGAVISLLALAFGQANGAVYSGLLVLALILMVTLVKGNAAGWYLQLLWSGFVLTMAGLLSLEMLFGWDVYPGPPKASFGRLLYIIANALILNGWFNDDVKQWFGLPGAASEDKTLS